ncbi:MAG: potassium channel protein [Planctomycetota bacterium]
MTETNSYSVDGGALARSRRQWIAGALVTLPLLATFVFMVLEGWGFLDSLYMSVITLSTVGYHEVNPLSDPGRVFVILYIVVGLGIFVVGTAELGEVILRGQLRRALGQRRVDSMLKTLSGHFVVCGYGRMGSSLCRHLAAEGRSCAVVDRDPTRLEQAQADGWPTVVGDATDDSVLEQAGLARASGLATVLPSDADNLYVVLSARLASADMMILARATDLRTDEKLKRAGANRVVNLHEAGAHKMARLLTKPSLADFIEILGIPGEGLELAQFAVSEKAPYCGHALADTDFQQKGVIIISVQKPNGECLMPPNAQTVLEANDKLTLLGAVAGMKGLLPENHGSA